jgi:hypothetical protein
MILTVVLVYLASFLVIAALYVATPRSDATSKALWDEWLERQQARRAQRASGQGRDEGVRAA